ncbi:MAG: hypothetical protein HND56_00635 [Pseudomonadota bacterium]|nr:hypothetical protein [Pseudomonadota bacterium]QKK04275.1 MAG: hypothetical protein HND56_00635 [Pseudomonadota bacterium]|tara:strand:- start:1537 stop:2046 length:510 start_codon:yes stop_codon:yes gene_type:complete
MDELQMIDMLVNQDWQTVRATNLYESLGKRFLLHITFETQKGNITLAGEAHSDKEGYDNSFSLSIPGLRPKPEWGISSSSKDVSWEIINFSQQWKNTPFETLMKAPRDVTFRHDPLIYIRQYPCKTFLDHFVSMELFKKTDDGRTVKFIITSSDEEPCCVEIEETIEEK